MRQAAGEEKRIKKMNTTVYTVHPLSELFINRIKFNSIDELIACTIPPLNLLGSWVRCGVGQTTLVDALNETNVTRFTP